MMSKFKDYYRKLNDAQREAVDTIEGPVMVIAGPGTGKTQVLCLRIANILLKTQVNPENILALTFTETGVSNMRQRLIDIIGATGYRVDISTFHGLANSMIQTHPEIFPKLTGATAISELGQIEIVETIISENNFQLIKPFGDPNYYVKPLIAAIGELKKENIDPDLFARKAQESLDEFEQIEDLMYESGRYKGRMKGKYTKLKREIDKNLELAQVYQLYQTELRSQKLYDFEDMLVELVKGLEIDQDFLLEIQEQFQYVLVDEHQDTNRVQNRVIELICGFHKSPNLFVVGDEKQAIFRFQGASLTNFLAVTALYPDTKVISLNLNYRSGQRILDAATSLMAESVSKTQLPLPLREKIQSATSNIGVKPEIANLADPDQQYAFIAYRIRQLIESGVDPRTISVLARTNKELKDLIPALESRDLPYVLLAKQNLLKDLIIHKLLLIFKAVYSLDRNVVEQVMYLDVFKIHPLDVIKLQSVAKTDKRDWWECLSEVADGQVTWRNRESLIDFYLKIISWHQLCRNQTLDVVFSQILAQSGVLDWSLKSCGVLSGSSKLRGLYKLVTDSLEKEPFMNLGRFLEMIETMDNHQLAVTVEAVGSETKGVQLMTAHGAKGLEFDYVFVVGLSESQWDKQRGAKTSFSLPYEKLQISLDVLETADKTADERRLFYVALTRAREKVIVTYPKANRDNRPQVPSRFITEIDSVTISQSKTSEFDSWFQEHPQALLTSRKFPNNDRRNITDLKPAISEMLEQQGLSATAVNNYLKCPWRFFFRSLMKLPEAKSGPLIFGSAIHQALHNYLVKLPRRQMELGEVVKVAGDYLAKQPMTETQLSSAKLKLKQILPPFYISKMKTWQPNYLSEIKINGVGLEPDIKLTGKLDLVIPESNGQVTVVDFKTGKPKSRNHIMGKTKSSDGDYYRQLVFYDLLLKRYQGGRLKMQMGIIEFVEPRENGKFVSEAFSVDESDTALLEDTIRNLVKEVRNLDFWNRRCTDTECEYCRLRELMGA